MYFNRGPGLLAITAATLVALVLPAAAKDMMFVPLGSAGEVVIVDIERDTIAGKISGLPAVHGLAGTPDGRFLIAGSFDEREPGTEIPGKPTGVSEEDHAAHHGKAASAHKEADSMVSTVSVVRTKDGSVVRRIDVPSAVHHVTVNPQGDVAVVTHPNHGGITAIDLSTYEVIDTIETGALPNYAVFSPNGDTLYVSNAGDNSVSAVDTKNWKIQWSTGVGASPEHVVLSQDGSLLYINNVDDGSVSVVAVGERKKIETIQVGTTPHGIDLSDNGRMLFVAALGDDKLVRFDTVTRTYKSAPLSPAPYHLTSVRQAGKLYVSSADQPKIWVLDQDTLAVLGEIDIGAKGHQMVQAPGT